MGRSLKKGPFADAHLLKKVDEMNAAGQKQGYQNLVPPFHQSSRRWLDIQSQFTMVENMFRYT